MVEAAETPPGKLNEAESRAVKTTLPTPLVAITKQPGATDDNIQQEVAYSLQ